MSHYKNFYPKQHNHFYTFIAKFLAFRDYNL